LKNFDVDSGVLKKAELSHDQLIKILYILTKAKEEKKKKKKRRRTQKRRNYEKK
jgi:hypothetical protein